MIANVYSEIERKKSKTKKVRSRRFVFSVFQYVAYFTESNQYLVVEAFHFRYMFFGWIRFFQMY